MTEDNRQPIEPRHVDFARALVALAREHGIRNLAAEYYGGGKDDDWRWTRVKLSWAIGRHGVESEITLHAEATHRCSEQEPKP